MATNTQAARIPRQFLQAPHAGMAAGQPRRSSESIPRAGNPLRAAQAGYDAEGQQLEAPYSSDLIGGLIGHSLNEGVRERNNAQLKTADDEVGQKKQDAADAYWNAFQKSGNPDQALLDAIHPDSGGHIHFMNKDALDAMTGLYQLTKQAGAEQQGFSTQDVGNGYSVLTGPGMKPQVLKPQKGPSGVTYLTDTQGNQFYSSHDNPGVAIPVMKQGAQGATSEQMIGKQAAGKPLSLQESNHLEGQRLASLALAKMQQSVGATGVIGFGSGMIERGIALHTPLSAPQAEAWNQAQNQLQTAANLTMGGSKLKKALEATLANLPKGDQANAFNANQAIPALRSTINMDMADLYNNLKDQHKPLTTAQQNMDMAGITPEYMAQVKNAKFKLQSAPGTLSENELAVLQNEARNNLTTGDESMRITRQLNQAGMISPQEFQTRAQKAPELLNTPPNEVRQNPRPWVPPQSAMQPGAPMAPQQGAPAPAPQPQDSQGAAAPIPPANAPLNPAQAQPAPDQSQGPSLTGPTGLSLSPPQGQTTGPVNLGQQSSALNPISSAQAAEMPGAPQAAQDQTQPAETASATAPIPPPNPQDNADIVSQHVDDVSQLLDSTRKILEATQPRPGVYSDQADQLGSSSKDE